MTTIALLCSPNMGIVDSWLPVLVRVHERHPDWRIVTVVPRGWGIGIRADAVALRELEKLSDGIAIEIMPGAYRWVTDFHSADRARARWVRTAERAKRVEGRLARHGVTAVRALRACIRVAAALAPEGTGRRWKADGRWSVVLLDAAVMSRIEVKELLRALGAPPCLSLSHGLGYPDPDGVADAVLGTPVHRAYAYSQQHRGRLMQDHGLAEATVRVTGVPRHDPEGPPAVRAAVEDRSDSEPETAWDGAVLVISRPATSDASVPSGPTDWFPAGRKASQLQAIHRVVCEERGLRLIVTMHPKERDDQAIREGLPEEGAGRTWMLTETHPLALAPRLRFAISFSSGVAVDLLSENVPTIEFQDVRGAYAFDGPDAYRDTEGRVLRTAERRYGLVLAADDEDDLREQVRRTIEDRSAVLAGLHHAYRRRYADSRGAVAGIVRDIEAYASGREPSGGPGIEH